MLYLKMSVMMMWPILSNIKRNFLDLTLILVDGNENIHMENLYRMF